MLEWLHLCFHYLRVEVARRFGIDDQRLHLSPDTRLHFLTVCQQFFVIHEVHGLLGVTRGRDLGSQFRNHGGVALPDRTAGLGLHPLEDDPAGKGLDSSECRDE